MTDKLIIFNKKGNFNIEGFMKLEDGKTLTAGFKGEKGEYIFLADSVLNNFDQKNYIRIFNSAIPKNAGVFLIKDNVGYLVLFYGDENILKNQFTKITDMLVENEFLPTSEEAKPELESAPQISEETSQPEYKETGYVLPEDFIQPPKETPNTFFDCNKEKFNDILYNNPPNETLKMLIPESKWVDVEEDNYTFGIIYDENAFPLYICYGFKLGWSEEPPEKLEGYCQWIPLDYNDPHGDGLWMIYINAQTGERLK